MWHPVGVSRSPAWILGFVSYGSVYPHFVQGFVVYAEVVGYLVNDRRSHLGDHFLVGFADVLDGPLEQGYLVGQREVVVVAVGQRDALIESEQRLFLLDAGAYELRGRSPVLDHYVEVVHAIQERRGEFLNRLHY